MVYSTIKIKYNIGTKFRLGFLPKLKTNYTLPAKHCPKQDELRYSVVIKTLQGARRPTVGG